MGVVAIAQVAGQGLNDQQDLNTIEAGFMVSQMYIIARL